jgi:TPR repeat protein
MKTTSTVSTLLAALLAAHLFLPAAWADETMPSADEARQLALRAYTEAAQEGDAEARFKLGWLYEQGQWVAKDPAQAAHWYRLAADQGETVAQYNLALLLPGWRKTRSRQPPG